MKTIRTLRQILCCLSLYFFAQPIYAQGVCKQWLGKLASSQGQVEIRRAGTSIWRPVMRGERYCDLDAIRTGRNSRAVLLLNTHPSNRTLTNLDQNTFLTFKSLGNEPSAFDLLIDLLKGGALFRSRQPNRLDIDTPFVNAVHRGTEFLVRVDADQTVVSVYDGQVATSNAEGRLTIDKGETALAKRGKAPVQYALLRPRDAVQWALNYPPVIDYHTASATPSHPAIGDALNAYRRGDLLEGLAILDKVPEAQREPDYYTTKAGLLLSVGRVDEATPAIEQALTLDSRNATAFALKSVIAVAQNRNDEAMQLAERAAQLDPESATPQVALSYAHQAKFELEKALESAEKAVELGPGNALALSRLSELKLSMGDLDEAVEAAEKAAALDPDLARTQTVLGFAHLTKIDIDEARQTFEKAIELDQAAPLSHLGLGLAKIRKGELKNGTDEIEIAASLDPDNSLIRSYLGKAFYEKKENILAGTELEIAKELDPNDPTPWFYDAIRKQTTNRPVEALHDMQKAIELNDNRAVYRSRLLLDDDLAARSASLGRIYNDLGFQQRGLLEGWKSVNAEPGNYSAHRLLADNYAALPRHEIARVSELLQSQLLQPINITPVQPQLSDSNLLILDGLGPADPSFNEFNPLFARNRFALQASGVYGSNETWGDEVTYSGLWNKLSYSLGQFHFETDGFRDNNNLKRNAYSGFIQGALTHYTNLQFEFRHDERKQGELALQFDPDFSTDFGEVRRADTFRFGFNQALSQQSWIIGSLIYQEVSISQEDQTEAILQTPFGPIPLNILQEDKIKRNGFIAELQHLYRGSRLNLISGIGHINQDIAQETFLDETRSSKTHPDIRKINFYSYLQFKILDELTATLGLSVDFLNIKKQLDESQVNPKLGLIWTPLSSTTLRLAAFREMSTTRTFNRTIEPTQVAGFNQFFDDTNGSDVWRYGVGIDHIFSKKIYGGIEYSKRDLDVPLLGDPGSDAKFFQWKEEFARAYLYLTPTPKLAFGIEYIFEGFDRRDDPLRSGVVDADTHRVPISLSYFHPSGLSTSLRLTYTDQNGDFQERDSDVEFSENDHFFLVDANINYRLPKRYGIVSVGVKNLFDNRFDFQDTDPDMPLFQPERLLFTRFTLAF